MREGGKITNKKLPLWTKLLLGLLLLLLAAGITAVTVLNVQRAEADRRGELPSLFGVRYCPVESSVMGAACPADSLLLVKPAQIYQTGELLLLSEGTGEFPAQTIGRRWLVVRLVEADGERLGMTLRGGARVPFEDGDVIGRVDKIIPGLGALYGMTLGVRGALLFIGVPLALAVILAAVMIHLAVSRKRRASAAAPEEALPLAETIPSRIRIIPGSMPPPAGRGTKDDPFAEVFDLSRQNTSPANAPGEVSGSRKKSRRRPLRLKGRDAPPVDESLFDPPDKLDLFVEPPGSREPSPAPPQPAFPRAVSGAGKEPPSSLGDTIEFEPIRPKPPEPSAVCEREAGGAVAIYEQERENAPSFAPAYLNKPTGESLDELKAVLREPCPHSVDIVLEGQDGALDEEKRKRLEEISAFDPDKMIEEIKRRNALYERSLWGIHPVQEEKEPSLPKNQLCDEKKPVAEKKRDHPASHRWRGVYSPRKKSAGRLTADEVLKNHRQDYVDRRFRPSFITVVGEADDSEEPSLSDFRGGYHNRNGGGA